jgi:hypothetical protein
LPVASPVASILAIAVLAEPHRAKALTSCRVATAGSGSSSSTAVAV